MINKLLLLALIIQIITNSKLHSQVTLFGIENSIEISPILMDEESYLNISLSNSMDLKTDLTNFEFDRLGRNNYTQLIIGSNVKKLKSQFGLTYNYNQFVSYGLEDYLNGIGLFYNYIQKFNDFTLMKIGSQIGYAKDNYHVSMYNEPDFDTIMHNLNIKLASSFIIHKFNIGVTWSKNHSTDGNMNYNSFYNYARFHFLYELYLKKELLLRPILYYEHKELINLWYAGIDLNLKDKISFGINYGYSRFLKLHIGFRLFEGLNLNFGREISSGLLQYKEFTIMLNYYIN